MSSSSSSSLKLFNTQIVNFAESLSNRFPKNASLKLAFTGLSALKQCNPMKTLELFSMYCCKYKEIIMNKNDVLLLNTNFVADDMNSTDQNNMNIMENLKQNWRDLDSEEKENMWKYMRVLFTLYERVKEERS